MHLGVNSIFQIAMLMSWINLKEFQSWLQVVKLTQLALICTLYSWHEMVIFFHPAEQPRLYSSIALPTNVVLLKNVFALPFILLWMCTVRCCLLGLWCVESLTLLRAHRAHYHQTQMCQKKGTNNLLGSVHCDQKTLLRISLFVGEGKSVVVIHSFQL